MVDLKGHLNFWVVLGLSCLVSPQGILCGQHMNQASNAVEHQVDDPVEIAPFSIRPPKGFKLNSPSATPPGTLVRAWNGPRRADGSAAMILVMILTPPPDYEVPELDAVLTKFLNGVKSRRSSWSSTKSKKVDINGINFLYSTWSGNDSLTGAEMHGHMLVATVNEKIVQLHTQDVSPHHTKSLAISVASLKSFINTPEQ